MARILTVFKSVKSLVCFLCLLLLVSCTRDVEEKTQVKIQLPKANLSKVQRKIQKARLAKSQNPTNANGGPPWNSSLNPTSIDEVNCYAVFVSGPELNMKKSSCSDATGTEKFRFGPNAMFFRAGQLISIDVPSGPDRRVVLAGGVSQNGACKILSPDQGPDFINFSEPFILANQNIGELTPGEKTVPIIATLKTNNKFTDCDFFNPDDIPGGTPPPTGTPFDPKKANLNFARVADSETDRFLLFADVFGDDNGNATYNVHFCNETDSPGCDPVLTGTPTPLTPAPGGAGLLFVEIDPTGASNDPKDLLNVAVKVSDPDGVNGPDRFDLKVPLVNQIHRSVGTQSSTLDSGTISGNNLSLNGTVGQFDFPLAANVGIGDVIEYDSNDNGAVNSFAIITHFITPEMVVIKTVAGEEPTPTTQSDLSTPTTDSDWKIHRAFTSLSNWELGTANTNIFSGALGALSETDRNIFSFNEAWVVSVYEGGELGGALDLTGWTTSGEASLTIQAPRHFFEVFEPQRHEGVFDISKHFLKGDDIAALNIPGEVQSLVIDGLQIAVNHAGPDPDPAINVNSSDGFVTIKNSIIKAITPTNTQGAGIKLPTTGSTAHIEIINNVIYGFDGNAAASGIDTTGPTTQVIYNNTIAETRTGIIGTANTIAKNNLASVTSTAGFGGSYEASSDFNSTNGTVTTGGSNDLASQTFTFVNPTAKDFHLSFSDTGARGQGTDLFNDPLFPVREDYEGTSRDPSIVPAFDIGADQEGFGTSISFGGHYFVLTSIAYNGDFATGFADGKTGANAACLTDLIANNWREKDKVTLDQFSVRAFLCDSSGCEDTLSNTMYEFATSGDPEAGGGVFFTDSTGLGPNDGGGVNFWQFPNFFNVVTPYWSGRTSNSPGQWGATPAAAHCNDWSDGTATPQGQEGLTNNGNGPRWSNAPKDCSETKRLICIVDN